MPRPGFGTTDLARRVSVHRRPTRHHGRGDGAAVSPAGL